MSPRAGRPARRAGFTLIELLAVIVILSILGYFLLTNVFSAKESVEGQATRAKLTQIAAMLADWEQDKGDWAASTPLEAWGVGPNLTNIGGECLYAVLCAEGAPGEGRLDEDPCNSDDDSNAVRIAGHQSLKLFEIADAWGNPIAYFHHRDYGREDTYVTFASEDGQATQGQVRALRNPKTDRYYEPKGFQLISAGPNGIFDRPGSETDDDITNFKR